MTEHYNCATGSYIRNERHLTDELKVLSDKATEYTGVPHNYAPIDYQDKEALGVTDEGLDATHDRAVAEGRKEPTGRTVF